LLHPDPSASRAAAERVVAVPGHLLQLTAERGEDNAWGIVDAVVAPERARVVVGDRVAERPGGGQEAALEELDQQLRMMEDRPLATQVRVLVPERVERVRIRGEDPLELASGDGVDVLL